MYFGFAHLSLLIKCLHGVCRIHHSSIVQPRILVVPYSNTLPVKSDSVSFIPTHHHHQRIYHHTHFSSLYLNDNIALSYQSKFSSSIIDIHLIEKNSFVQLVIQMLLHMLAIKHRQLS